MIALNRVVTISFFCLATATSIAAAPTLLNDPVDVSCDFRAQENSYYLADQLEDFNPATHAGKVAWKISGTETH